MKKILVINVNWVGDAIFSAPVFKALKKTYPDATISCLAVPRIKEILESNPFIDQIIPYDERGTHGSPWAKFILISQLRREKFDVAFLLHRSLTRALLVYLSGIPRRVGYDTKGRALLLTHHVKPLNGITHRSDYYLNVVESFGIKVEDRSCELVVPPLVQEEVHHLLKQHGIRPEDFLVVVHPGGNWDLKRWSTANFAELIRRIRTEFQAKVILTGTAQEITLVQDIASLSKVESVILAGQTTLKILAAIMQRADLVISADSGPLHLANCVGTSVIALFGPTRPEVTGPRGKGQLMVLQKDVGCNREPCYNLECPDNICMRSLTVDEVVHAVQQIRN